MDKLARGIVAAAQAEIDRRRAEPRAVGYIRVSTAEQAAGGLGLDAQEMAIREECRRRGWQLVEVFTDAGLSATSRSRPALDAALDGLAASPPLAGALVVAKLDRLARSIPDYARLVEQARAHGWSLIALDSPEASTPQGEAMQAMTAVFAQLEKRLVSQRTREALAAARARGVTLGRPVEVEDQVVELIVGLHRRRRWTARAIGRHLTAEGIPAPRGGTTWHPATVAGIITRAGGRLRPGRPRKPRQTGRSGGRARKTSR